MIYLDAAATTFQKPRAVADAAAGAFYRLSSPGRGSYRAAELAAETAFRCRSEAAQLFHVPSEEQVVFTFNATHGLNIAIKSLVSPGDTVVISGYEHNAVVRPLHAIEGVTVKIARGALFDSAAVLREFEARLTPEVSAAVCTHVSNVFGFVLPIGEIAALCRRRGIPLIVDASQSAGILPVDFQEWGAAFVAMPGHKGLYGPQGTGLLLCDHDAVPLMEGGTGSQSRPVEMPDYLPDRLEAGTHNMPGIAGLLEGIRFVRRTGPEAIACHERELIRLAAAGLRDEPWLEVFNGTASGAQSGVLALNVRGEDCEETAAWLARQDIAVRAGLHCAPLAHETAGTVERGAVRVSVSVFNTEREIQYFLKKIRELLENRQKGRPKTV